MKATLTRGTPTSASLIWPSSKRPSSAPPSSPCCRATWLGFGFGFGLQLGIGVEVGLGLGLGLGLGIHHDDLRQLLRIHYRGEAHLTLGVSRVRVTVRVRVGVGVGVRVGVRVRVIRGRVTVLAQ